MELRHEVKRIVDAAPYQYADVRLDDTTSLGISFAGEQLKKVGRSFLRGTHTRVIHKGLMGTCSVTNPTEVEEGLELAARASKAMDASGRFNGRLAPAPREIGEFHYTLKENPRDISVEEKIDLARHYNEIALQHPLVASTSINYEEHLGFTVYVNSEGTSLFQEQIFCKLAGSIFAKDGSLVQSVSFNFGSGPEFSRLRNREAEVEETLATAVDLLKSEPVRGGAYRVILDPKVAGVFVHEAFGHLSESDAIINNEKLLEEMRIGRRLGPEILSISDQGNFPGAPGTYIWDDEGVAAGKSELVRQGILSGRLHSRASAEFFDEKPTGNMRAVDYRFNPLVRMSNIFVENGETPFDELLELCGDGLYLIGAKGGQTVGDLFTFGAQYGWEVKGGKKTRLVRDINMSGNLFTTLANVMAVGNDFVMNESSGCGKGSVGPMQLLSASGHGGPHILIDGIVIGGV